MPITDVVTQNRIRTCMACLEQISKVWLVAKMIQNLFEFILSEKGFGDCLEDGPGKLHNKNLSLLDKISDDAARNKNKGIGTERPEKLGERLASQSPALTPSLLAHMFAALNSGTSSGSPGHGDSPRDSVDINKNSHYQKTSHLTGVAREEIYKAHLVFETQNVPPVSQQFMEEPTNEHIAAETPVNMHTSQYGPQKTHIYHNQETYTRLQTMARGHGLVEGPQFPQDGGLVQNMVDGTQYFPINVGELQHSYPVNELGDHASRSIYPSVNITTDQPPASTGPNVLEWSVESIHIWCRFEIPRSCVLTFNAH